MEMKAELVNEQKWEEAKHLEKEIRKSVKKDKEEHLLQQMEEIRDGQHDWTVIKKLKGKFVPKMCKFKDKSGKRIPASEFPEKAAEYYAEEQWDKNANLPEAKSNPEIFPNAIQIPGCMDAWSRESSPSIGGKFRVTWMPLRVRMFLKKGRMVDVLL